MAVRTSNVFSMEKLPLLVHGKSITHQERQGNVGAEHRTPSSRQKSNGFVCRSHIAEAPIDVVERGVVILIAPGGRTISYEDYSEPAGIGDIWFTRETCTQPQYGCRLGR